MNQPVAGRTVQRSLADLEKAALVIIGEASVSPSFVCDPATLGVLCDTVRLCREYADQMAKALLAVKPDTHKLAAHLMPIATLAKHVHDDLFTFACGQGIFNKQGRELSCGDINELGRLAGLALRDFAAPDHPDDAAPFAPLGKLPEALAPPAAPLTITLPHRLNLNHNGGCHMVARPGGDFIKASVIKARLIAAGITVIEET